METQPRILFFSWDGVGVGHLRRICRIAKALQGPAACLVVSGAREVAWLVPAECEYVHIPSLDRLSVSRAARRKVTPFMDLSGGEARRMRAALVEAVLAAFDPHAVVIDHLPLGKNEELAETVMRHPAKKVFVMRGVHNPADAQAEIFAGAALQALKERYAAILIASDRSVCNTVEEAGIPPSLSKKTHYVGYVSEPVGAATIERLRAARGVEPGRKWIVCSAGGSAEGNPLICECMRLSEKFSEAVFDIVLGSRLSSGNPQLHPDEGYPAFERVRIRGDCTELSLLHAAADVVICHGGYNSVVETLEGHAALICVPDALPFATERLLHATKLAPFVPLHVAPSVESLEATLADCVTGTAAPYRTVRGRDKLNFEGASGARDHILSILSA